ncbi:MAG: DUF2769 domain-containing protein [Methanomicrobiales archaeon]|nr:DUF2769 domain-containing protein [Methanomicrobiales archaeon]
MDKFDKTMKDFLGKKPDEQKKILSSLQDMCICPTCPTHTQCAKDKNEVLFCVVGMDFGCIAEDKGCLCPGCPVTEVMGLSFNRFCMNGSEATLRYYSGLKK